MRRQRSAREELRDLIEGYRLTHALGVAAELDIAGALLEGPREVAALASEVGAEPDALRRVLRLLSAHGVFHLQDGSVVTHTPLSELLRTDDDDSLAGWARWHASEWMSSSWSALGHAVRSGEPAFEHVYGRPAYALFRDVPAARALFDEAMAAVADEGIDDLLAAIHAPSGGLIVDVGGGDGAVLSSVLRAYPSLRGALLERPDVVDAATVRLRADGVLDRCKVVGGDFFKAVPPQGDAYLLRAILHNWRDDEAVQILAACRNAMKPSGVVVLSEYLVPDGDDVSRAKSQDVAMMVMQRGRERTQDEFAQLLARAGLVLSDVAESSESLAVLTARVL